MLGRLAQRGRGHDRRKCREHRHAGGQQDTAGRHRAVARQHRSMVDRRAAVGYGTKGAATRAEGTAADAVRYGWDMLEHVPATSLVVLMGSSGAGKSTFARGHFATEAILASDAYRARLSGSEADQSVTAEAFRLLHADAEARLAAGKLTVIDATNVLHDARRPLLELAERHGRPAVAVVLETSLAQCLAWNATRPGRVVPPGVIRRQYQQLQRALPGLAREGFDLVLRVTEAWLRRAERSARHRGRVGSGSPTRWADRASRGESTSTSQRRARSRRCEPAAACEAHLRGCAAAGPGSCRRRCRVGASSGPPISC